METNDDIFDPRRLGELWARREEEETERGEAEPGERAAKPLRDPAREALDKLEASIRRQLGRKVERILPLVKRIRELAEAPIVKREKEAVAAAAAAEGGAGEEGAGTNGAPPEETPAEAPPEAGETKGPRKAIAKRKPRKKALPRRAHGGGSRAEQLAQHGGLGTAAGTVRNLDVLRERGEELDEETEEAAGKPPAPFTVGGAYGKATTHDAPRGLEGVRHFAGIAGLAPVEELAGGAQHAELVEKRTREATEDRLSGKTPEPEKPLFEDKAGLAELLDKLEDIFTALALAPS